MIRISDWYGRLGNNIIQIINGIYLARKHNLKFEYPHHPIIQKKVFNYRNENTNNDINLFDRYYDIDNEYLKEYPSKEDVHNIIKNDMISLINYNPQNIELTDNDLVIHIRSGDVYYKIGQNFNTTKQLDMVYKTKDMYSQPPLSFYEKIIDETNYDRYFLVAENNMCPIIDILLKKYPKIIPIMNNSYQKLFHINEQLINDLYYLMEAKNLVLSNSSIVYTIVPFIKNLKKIYVPESLFKNHVKYPLYNEIDLIYFIDNCQEYNYYEFPNYYIDTDISILLQYPIENIKKYTI
jgi:hypothetical protein